MNAPSSIVARPSLLGTLHLMVIDDQAAAIKIIKDMLSAMGVPPVIAINEPQKALYVLASDHVAVDAILCDWRMPGMSGLEVLRQVRRTKPDLPFLMVTGAADVSSVLAAKEHGVSGYIRKPFSADELRRKLHAIARVKAHRGCTARALS